ncbi:MAG: hypothetical protein IM600_14525 [Bacteroidetes bacterium]|nr:hypothetical protein [Bacteroidota bacterium]
MLGFTKPSRTVVLQHFQYYTDIKKMQVPGLTGLITNTLVYQYNYSWNHVCYRSTLQLKVNEFMQGPSGRLIFLGQKKDTITKGWVSPSFNLGPVSANIGY